MPPRTPSQSSPLRSPLTSVDVTYQPRGAFSFSHLETHYTALRRRRRRAIVDISLILRKVCTTSFRCSIMIYGDNLPSNTH